MVREFNKSQQISKEFPAALSNLPLEETNNVFHKPEDQVAGVQRLVPSLQTVTSRRLKGLEKEILSQFTT